MLKLSYYNGDKCEGSGKSHVVNIYFLCDVNSGVVSTLTSYVYVCACVCVSVCVCVCE